MKAWISVLGRKYPFTHNLSSLKRILKGAGEPFPDLPVPLSLLQPYAVQFRYDPGSTLTDEERQSVRQTVIIFQEHVITRILELEASEA